MENHLKKMPSPLLSLVPILVLVALLFVTIRTFGSDALSGGSQVVLLTTTAVASLLAMIFCKVKWRDIEEAICKNILGVATAIIILLLIGALSGSWMISGIVPTLIYYGMQIIHPSFFLASCCVICAVVSVMTGSSWTTIATIGIALMGIGEAQGFATGWVAGAIISGAYFGDKISPLSDTTVLASSVTHTPLFSHIRYMMLTTIPSMVITLIIFTIAGFTHTSNASGQIAEFAASLNESFNISLWLLIVPVVTGILIAKKVPSLINKYSASDGDLFPWGFRALGLGKLIGTRTWGGIIGISGPLPYMDGTDIRVPFFTSYDPKTGNWIIENHGVDPDILIDNDPIKEWNGEDQQLDRAIEEVMKQLKERKPLAPVPAPRDWSHK